MIVFKGFIMRFVRFLFFMTLLNVGKIGVFGLVLCVLWGGCDFRVEFILKYLKTRDLGLKKPTLTKTQPNQVSIKLGIPLLL